MTEQEMAIKLADEYEEQGYIDIACNNTELDLVIKCMKTYSNIVHCTEFIYQKDCHQQIRHRKLNSDGSCFEVSAALRITYCSYGQRKDSEPN